MSSSDPKLIPLRIRLPYSSEEEFLEKYGSNVARGGVFIATRALKPEGTALSFEFVLADGARLLRGEGVVQKTQVDEGGGRSGMTVRFSRLDARSKALVDRVIARRLGVIPRPPEEPGGEPKAPPAAPAPALLSPEQKFRRRQSLLEVPVATAPATQAGPDHILGIDLGTTNCRAAVYQEGAARMVPFDKDGRTFAIPSVVALDDKDRVLVGLRAKAQTLVDPMHTVFGAKRLMGRRARSRKIRELSKRFPYAIVPDAEGDAGVQLRGKTFTLPEIAAMLLSSVKASAQEMLGREVTRAVLCVPAYFNDHQRAAMLQAGRLAGLKVLRILNEPSAVSLAFGYGKGLARKRVLVYDLGGGTFDASVVELTGDDL